MIIKAKKKGKTKAKTKVKAKATGKKVPTGFFSLHRNRVELQRMISEEIDRVSAMPSEYQVSFALAMIAFLMPSEHPNMKERDRALTYLVNAGAEIIRTSPRVFATDDLDTLEKKSKELERERKRKIKGAGDITAH